MKRKNKAAKFWISASLILEIGIGGCSYKLYKKSVNINDQPIIEKAQEQLTTNKDVIINLVNEQYKEIKEEEIKDYRAFLDKHYSFLSEEVRDAITKVGVILEYDNDVNKILGADENTVMSNDKVRIYNEYNGSKIALEENQGICINYTEILNTIINYEYDDIEAYLMTGKSSGLSHGWSLIKDNDGEFKQIDMTNLDSLYNEQKDLTLIENAINFIFLNKDGKVVNNSVIKLPNHEFDNTSKQIIEELQNKKIKQEKINKMFSIIITSSNVLCIINGLSIIIAYYIISKNKYNKSKKVRKNK